MKLEDYNKYYIQNSDHYLMPKEVLEELFNEMVNWKKEAKKEKKHLEKLRNGYKIKLENLLAEGIEVDPEDFYLAEIEGKANDYDKLLVQQQEFIKYLEDEIKRLEENNIYQPLQKMAVVTHKHNLQKYKEIIGDDE